MKEVFFATGNSNKLREIREILGKGWKVLSIRDLEEPIEVDETAPTLEGNAILKAKTIFELTGVDCFADDTGLEVEALGGQPGVHTARYAGPECDPQQNMSKLLKALEGMESRKAQFKTVIAWYDGKDIKLFEGVLKGSIALQQSGTEGFGYDPIFIPAGSNRSLASFGPSEKNTISHRGMAMQKFISFLKTLTDE